MKRNGGSTHPATRLQGLEQSGETPEQQSRAAVEPAKTPEPPRTSRRGKPSEPPLADICDASISEFRLHLAWTRTCAGRVLSGAIFYFVVLLVGCAYVLTHGLASGIAGSPAGEFVAASPWSSFGVAASPGVLLLTVFSFLMNNTSRSHDELTTADAKRAVAQLTNDPSILTKLVDALLAVDRNPKLRGDESIADIERTRRPLRTFFAGINGWIREIVKGRRVRILAEAAEQEAAAKEATALKAIEDKAKAGEAARSARERDSA